MPRLLMHDSRKEGGLIKKISQLFVKTAFKANVVRLIFANTKLAPLKKMCKGTRNTIFENIQSTVNQHQNFWTTDCP